VARAVLAASDGVDVIGTTFNPYEQKWDGIVPIEIDPLTRVRFLVKELRSSIILGPATDHLGAVPND